MRFGFEQSWRTTVEEVLDLYVDPGFWESLHGLSKTGAPDVLDVSRSGDDVLVALRYRFVAELPRDVGRFVDPGNVSWVERTEWHLSTATADVQFLPDQASSLMRATAAVELSQAGDEALRQVRGDLSVRIPLVGRRVEKAVVEGIGEHLEEEADAVADRLES